MYTTKLLVVLCSQLSFFILYLVRATLQLLVCLLTGWAVTVKQYSVMGWRFSTVRLVWFVITELTRPESQLPFR